jgi:hypothetical protein
MACEDIIKESSRKKAVSSIQGGDVVGVAVFGGWGIDEVHWVVC